MAPRNAKKQSALEYGKGGAANLVKLDDHRARIDFEDGESVNLQVKQGNVFEDETATLPEHVPFKALAVNKPFPVKVSFEKGDKRVLFINPLTGEYRVKFVRFQAPEGSEPSWAEKQGKGNRPYREANPFFEIVDGRWKGTVIRGRLFDNFGLWEEDGFTTVFGNGSGAETLRDFCDAVGFDYTTTPFSENLLPLIQKTALENTKEFSIILTKGYIGNILPGFNEEEVYADPEPSETAESLLDT